MRERTMPSDALGSISKISSKFFHEVMPVALASVIGTMLVNHYSRQPASPSVVVQAPQPPASAEAVLQTLHEEHELIVDYLRRDADAALVRGSPAAPAVEDRPNKVRTVSAERATPRPPPRPAPEKQIAARDPEPLAPVLLVTAAPLPPAEPAAARPARSAGVVDTVRDWAFNISALPGRALALRLFDDPPAPPLPLPVGLQVSHED
jgi:hypothetical protein